MRLFGEGTSLESQVDGIAVEEFQKPSRTYRALNFWSWNDDLDLDELQWQLRRIQEAGWGGTYLHARPGLLTPYLSEAWMEAVRVSVKAGRDLGLDIWLYDDDSWPSGTAGGAVCLQNPEYRQRVLVRYRSGEPCAQGERLVGRDEKWLYFEHLMSMGGHFNSAMIDAINPQAVRSFIELTYERYRRQFGDEFAKTIPGIFMDEPHLTSRYAQPANSTAWSANLHEQFIARWGYDLRDHLASLFDASGDWAQVRYHYWRLLDELMASSFNQQIYEWCERNGLMFVGHMTCEESLYSQLAWSGSVMSTYAFFHIPGVDILGRKIDEAVTIKQCVSVAHQLGRERVQSELFGTSGANATLEDMKWITDWQLALGVNMFCVHLSNYSIRGCRKHDCPPNVFFHQPYWKHVPALSEHMARCSYALLRGKPLTEVLVLHPIESAWMRFVPPNGEKMFDHGHESMADLQEHLLKLSENLIGLHRDYDFGAESIMEGRTHVADGRLHVGEATYHTVIIPAIETIRRETLDWLLKFVEQGGLLIATGKLPERVDGQLCESVARLARAVHQIENSSEALRGLLDKHRPQSLVVTSKGTAKVMSAQRLLDDGYVLFLANTDRTQDAELTIEVNDKSGELGVCHWDSLTGQPCPVFSEQVDGKLLIRLTLPPVGSRLLEIAPASRLPEVADPILSATNIYSGQTPVAMTGPNTQWKVTRSDPNILALNRCRFRLSVDDEWSAIKSTSSIQTQLVDRDFHGRVELEYEFNWTASAFPDTTRLVVEEAGEWHIFVNGEVCKWTGDSYWLDRAFLPVPISHALKMGSNTVRMSRVFSPPRFGGPAFTPRLRGVEIEPVYVTGDFAVRAQLEAPIHTVHPAWGLTGLPLPSTQLLAAPFEIVDEPGTCRLGDLVTQGYPFYAGTIELSAHVSAERFCGLIRLQDVQACVVEVVVNGAVPRTLCWSPWQVDVSDDLVPGDNLVCLRLTNSLRNVMGHHHVILQGEGDISHLAVSAYCHMPGASGKHWTPPPIPKGQYRFASFGVGGVEVV